ncbi:MAG: hypothetical protein ACFFAN_15635 [Promethearchaeota archaeon]
MMEKLDAIIFKFIEIRKYRNCSKIELSCPERAILPIKYQTI